MKVTYEKQQEKCLTLMHKVYQGEKLTCALCKSHNIGSNIITAFKELKLVDSHGNSLMKNKPNIRSAKKLIGAYRDVNKKHKSTKRKKKKIEISILWGLIKIRK